MEIIVEIPELDYDTWGDFVCDNVSILADALRVKFSHESEDTLLSTVIGLRRYFLNHLMIQFRSEGVMKITRSEPKIELSRSFRTIRASDFDAYVDGGILSFRETGFDKSTIRNIVFKDFKKCVSKYAKFDADTERRFAAILEDTTSVEKWMKPPITAFWIPYVIGNDLSNYTPDFIIETTDTKWIVEIKSADDIDDRKVLAKAKATRRWCQDVNFITSRKQWKYTIISHDEVREDRTLLSLLRI